ncbi:hypothetical protein [Clostridium folliculivorans]|uniref:Uncharacterized protein n=1 Tax=Clostridium folliculivorans TaxID=2886038 RepID=A0A9W5Y5I1_9CLOT|nr:hypothetical protein [Clostridium folliculivorans]GKU26915.1 hypothetical protein CFOLD11_37420 [Clostridium folliculivorans]GKU31566.1 hypothetical protein CFB3_36730 [Clostridium folliculivorans]
MVNKINYKYRLILCIIVISILSVLVGALKKNDVEQYKVFKLYSIDADNNVSDSVDKAVLKKLNILNKNFSQSYKGNFKIDVLPAEGINSRYRIMFTSEGGLDGQAMSKVYDDYANMLKNSSVVFHISPIEYDNVEYTNIKLHSTLISIVQAVLYSLVLLFLYRIIKPLNINENILGALSIVVFLVSTVFNLFAAVLAVGIAVIIFHNIINKTKEYKKTLIKLSVLALVVRVLVTIAMLMYNYYKYSTLFSYSQTDEIFYYSSSDYIYQSLVNFAWPNLKAITGIDQYGYNLFMGVVKLINHGDIFISVKIINILVSVIFVLLIFKFVYSVTENYDVAKISALMMAVMPTFAVFSSFALRDIFISIIIFLILYEVILMNKSTNKIRNIVICFFLMIALWYLRHYALLLVLMLVALYVVIGFLRSKRINIIAILVSMLVLAVGLVVVASKIYALNIFIMLKFYVESQGILKFLSGIILSIVNLDFLINSGETIYKSTKSLILRIIYPETIFLILSFPIMCLGFIKGLKKDISFVITIIVMFVGFIAIYKMQYGGWFLRTQLQIFPFQYMFIAWGLVTMVDDSDSRLARTVKKLINKL